MFGEHNKFYRVLAIVILPIVLVSYIFFGLYPGALKIVIKLLCILLAIGILWFAFCWYAIGRSEAWQNKFDEL